MAALAGLLQCPTAPVRSTLPLQPGSASLAIQMTPSLCSNASLAAAMSSCTVQNRQLEEDLRSHLSEKKGIFDATPVTDTFNSLPSYNCFINP